MNKNNQSGFTLIELVVVIVILAILAVVAFPRFISYQRDAHESRADSAFASFSSAVQLYHSKWLTQGEPSPQHPVNYGQGEIYPSRQGFPISVGNKYDGQQVSGGECVELWHALTNNDLTISAMIGSDSILPSTTDIVSWYRTGKDGLECTYYYTTGYHEDEKMPLMIYSPLTGNISYESVPNNRQPIVKP